MHLVRDIITDKFLYRLADNIPANKVLHLGASLHVPAATVSRIRGEHLSILDQTAKILQTWRDRLHKDDNWQEILLRALESCGLIQIVQDVEEGKLSWKYILGKHISQL